MNHKVCSPSPSPVFNRVPYKKPPPVQSGSKKQLNFNQKKSTTTGESETVQKNGSSGSCDNLATSSESVDDKPLDLPESRGVKLENNIIFHSFIANVNNCLT